MSFPRTLRQYLDLSGQTQSLVARRAGISPASLSRYLRGSVTPSRDAVEALDQELTASGELLAAWKAHLSGENLPPFLRDIGALELNAKRIDLVSPVGVPGLLWCSQYGELAYRAGRKVTDVSGMAKHRAQRLGQLHAEVSAVFPLAALTGLPRTVADAQVEHLLSLPDRVTVHLLPESSLLLGIPGPFMLFTLPPNRQVVTSDHLEGSVVHPGASVGRAAEILRDALALALPPSLSTGALKEF